MTQKEQQQLRRVQNLLWLAMGLLMMAEVSSLLKETGHYVLTSLVAAGVFTVHWFTRKYRSGKNWQKIFSMALPLLTIFGPIIYFGFRVFVFDAVIPWWQLIIVCGYVLPLVLILLVNRLIGRLLANSLL